MRVLVTGSGGMVGRAVVSHCRDLSDQVLATTHSEMDITDSAAVRRTIGDFRPDTVINCAAWTDVDGCESDSVQAFNANAGGPENLASGCREFAASLITISTDYVFGGAKEGFYTQRDDPDPISVYGRSKLRGESLSRLACARTTVVRSGWIFGPGGRNFLSRVPEFGARGGAIKAISDSWGTPTYALDLAKRLRELAEIDIPGTYHVVNGGAGCTFEEFVRMAFGFGKFDISVVSGNSMSDLRRPAPRPRNSRLKCILSPAIGLSALPDWRVSLQKFVDTEILRQAT